jgi:hypothetical protein
LEALQVVQNAGIDPTPNIAFDALQMSMHSFEAKEFRYPLPFSSTIFTVLPLTKPGVASAVTVSTK